MITITHGMKASFQSKLNLYRKIRLCEAVRIDGPFEVVTREGILSCLDGYLSWDSEGWPYPIAKAEFETIYELAGSVKPMPVPANSPTGDE